MEKVKLFDSHEKALEIVPTNQIKLLKVKGNRLCISNYNDKIFVTDDMCPHLGHPMHQGHLNPFGEIICSLHSYCFNLSTGDEMSNRCRAIKTYKVKIETNGVYLYI